MWTPSLQTRHTGAICTVVQRINYNTRMIYVRAIVILFRNPNTVRCTSFVSSRLSNTVVSLFLFFLAQPYTREHYECLTGGGEGGRGNKTFYPSRGRPHVTGSYRCARTDGERSISYCVKRIPTAVFADAKLTPRGLSECLSVIDRSAARGRRCGVSLSRRPMVSG